MKEKTDGSPGLAGDSKACEKRRLKRVRPIFDRQTGQVIRRGRWVRIAEEQPSDPTSPLPNLEASASRSKVWTFNEAIVKKLDVVTPDQPQHNVYLVGAHLEPLPHRVHSDQKNALILKRDRTILRHRLALLRSLREAEKNGAISNKDVRRLATAWANRYGQEVPAVATVRRWLANGLGGDRRVQTRRPDRITRSGPKRD